MYRFVQLSSLEKVMPKDDLRQRQEHLRMSAPRNENISYQIAYTIDLDDAEGFIYRGAIYCRVSVESPLAPNITLREVENVPVSLPCFQMLEDSDFISKEPGLFPDVLRPLSKPYVGTVLHRCGSLWVTVKLDGTVQAGTYPVDIRFCDEARGLDICKHMDIEVIDACIPKQELLYTQWFHSDCIANYYQVKVFSEKHWALIEKFMRAAADSGINLLLSAAAGYGSRRRTSYGAAGGCGQGRGRISL